MVVRVVGASGETLDGSWSEAVPSQEATVVCEGWGAGAGGLAAQSLGDVAVATVVAVIHGARLVLTLFQICRESRGQQHQGAPSPWRAASRTARFLSPKAHSMFCLWATLNPKLSFSLLQALLH